MTISYLYYKTGQGVNFGSCEGKWIEDEFFPSEWYFRRVKAKLEKKGWKVEIEASTPELRAEQLQRIRSTPPTQGNKQ